MLAVYGIDDSEANAASDDWPGMLDLGRGALTPPGAGSSSLSGQRMKAELLRPAASSGSVPLSLDETHLGLDVKTPGHGWREFLGRLQPPPWRPPCLLTSH